MRNPAVNVNLSARGSTDRWRGTALESGALRGWLTDRGSLTRRLKQASRRFRVVRLAQGRAGVCVDEAACLGDARPRRRNFIVREVLLECDGRPTVFAHSVIAAQALHGPLRWLAGLGSRPLGEALFGDPRVRRGPLAFRRLRAPDRRYLRAASQLAARGQPVPSALWARRSKFSVCGHLLLVTEVFLPAVACLENSLAEALAPALRDTSTPALAPALATTSEPAPVPASVPFRSGRPERTCDDSADGR